jgi:hypothetical protein
LEGRRTNRCAIPAFGAFGRNRTCNLLITNQLRYQLRHEGIAKAEGLEPSSFDVESKIKMLLFFFLSEKKINILSA